MTDESARAAEDDLIRIAMGILEDRMRRPGGAITSPEECADYLRMRIGELTYEAFGALWLDNRHRLIEARELFRGTIDGASVHPREVVREGLALNAAAVIFYHNHPSGVADPSQADLRITQKLRDALALVEIRSLDHLIIGDGHVSLAERGLM
jgi:DNA repair protein RadC